MLISTIRTALGNRARTINGLHVLDSWWGTITCPGVVVGFPEVDFDSTMARGSDDYVFPVDLILSLTNARAIGAALDGYMAGHGTNSIKAALESTASVALDASVNVMSATPERRTLPDGGDYLVAAFRARVVVSGTS